MKSESEEATKFQHSRLVIYALFAIFIAVNLFEGLAADRLSKKTPSEWNALAPDYLEFNYGLSSILDATFRILIAIAALYCIKSEDKIKSFRCLNWKLALKTLCVRFLIQCGEVMTTMGYVFLNASTTAVINQARIPLVGLLGYLILCKCLSRDQTIYAIAIIPLAVQFNLLGGFNGDNRFLGYIMCALAVIFMSVSNVLVEKLLKKDFAHLPAWDQQLLFATFDLPVMFVLYAILTWFDKDVSGIQTRAWSPLDSTNLNNWYWIVSFGMNGAIWGFARLCILSFQDAMWLNLSTVLVMGLMWLGEIGMLWYDNGYIEFHVAKFLCLVSLSCILMGYECATRDMEEKQKKEANKSDSIFEPML